ncbi:NADPH:quinone reductase [Lentzea pudingi]|uniref:NADPH:quinone reductase n=1 Tax=Lentzea pudingi TaxID=1789439 RepID=A0ABQ2HVK2_9PSEU|nr:zinc-binding alcohol dehydrogenase family protein [Lentzea pudingi]GGM92892.1 NADPH:quinone reductase [Lentzea pudingi]
MNPASAATMRAAVLDAPGPPEALTLKNLPIPEPQPGRIRIRVRAFGLNRSELYTRQGLSGDAVTFPRVLGIEAVGVVDLDPSGRLSRGQQVAAMMGGMGRQFDGGYAEYICVPETSVIPFSSDLDWAVLGAVPEMLQTAHGSLTTGIGLRSGQSVLVRGGTSSVGLAVASLAKKLGATVLATTRDHAKTGLLRQHGADHVLIDDGAIAARVRRHFPEGVDGAIELVGTSSLPDTLRATRVQGTVCFTGMLAGEWTIPQFYPMDVIPQGVRLTAYAGEAHNLDAGVLQEYLDDVAEGLLRVPAGNRYRLEDIVQAHHDMEANRIGGKGVVLV